MFTRKDRCTGGRLHESCNEVLQLNALNLFVLAQFRNFSFMVFQSLSESVNLLVFSELLASSCVPLQLAVRLCLAGLEDVREDGPSEAGNLEPQKLTVLLSPVAERLAQTQPNQSRWPTT